MSELLREVARHLRKVASEHGTPDHCAVVVITISRDGQTDSMFFGDEDAAGTAARALPHIAADFVQQISGAVGFTFPAPELSNSGDSLKLRTPTAPGDLISAERMAAEVISKAKR